MRNITEIIIHCTATRRDFMEGAPTVAKVREVKRWHVEGNGWSDIGYHYLIDRDGTLAEGRPLERTGAHVKGHNTGTIGIALFGGHGSAETDAFHDHFNIGQNETLKQLIADLQDRFGPLKISGHNQYAAKACPGFSVPTWLATDGDTQEPETPEDPATDAARLRWRLAAIRDTAEQALAGE
ncbi:N-acetylmuramoyl-L-alanine amidase [Pseudooceanicola sp.]|uniref:N-acetylmuramoyl-L-alanine amidase n=1 Tax=Pseudooceanicola sp. TaxID=1914328 RepID=UPI004059C7F7